MENENTPTPAADEPAVYQPLAPAPPRVAEPDDANDSFLSSPPSYFNLFD